MRRHGCGDIYVLFQFNNIHAIYAPIVPINTPLAPTDTDVDVPTHDNSVAQNVVYIFYMLCTRLFIW